MTTTQNLPATATTASAAIKGNPWRPSLRGVALATWIETLRRRPSKKGYLAYGAILASIIALGAFAAAASGPGKTSVPLELVLVMILGAGVLIGPSLSATSINGDSSEGVLAPLQMSRLTAGDLALGKLLSSWAVCIAALLTTTPFLLYAFARSGWTFAELARVLAVILFMVLAFTAVGLAWSSIAARAVASVSLTHLTSGMLGLGTLLLFAFTMPLVSEDVQLVNYDNDYSLMTDEQAADVHFDASTLPCVEVDSVQTISHTQKTAWLLLINPAVVIAETSPLIDMDTYEKDGRAAPGLFAGIHREVAGAELGPETPVAYNACTNDWGDPDAWHKRQVAEANYPGAPWLGLGLAGAMLIGSMWIVVRRLRVPYKTLRAGTRVA